MKTHIITLALCLLALGAQAQTEYRIDQPLPGDIRKVQVYEGWNVRLIHDTVNLISIATPCEYYFAEGNEPQISRQGSDGWFSIWKNTSMPKGTLVELHYSHSLQRLDVQPGATVSADTLLMYNDTVKMGKSAEVYVRRGATLRVKELRCRRQKGQPGYLVIAADTAATVHIGTVQTGHLSLWSMQEATLMLDSIDAREVTYYRDPLSHDNLWHSNPDRNIKVKTSNRWFMKGLNELRNTIDFAYNTPLGLYNSPYSTTFDVTTIVGLKTNIVPFCTNWGISLGLDYGLNVVGLGNNVSLSGRQLALDTVTPGVNRKHSLMHMYVSLPVRLHYIPTSGYMYNLFHDLHLGVEPMVNFWQRYTSDQLNPDNRWTTATDKVSVYRPFQVRAEVGFRFRYLLHIEFNFYADLLPTYRSATGMSNVHTFGFQIRF